jgi:hypothetical protein
MPLPRPPTPYQEKVVISYDHPQVTATTTWKIFKAKGRPFRIDSVRYINPTGLAADATNVFAGTLKNGSTVMATIFDTDSDTGAALAADTFVDGTLSATQANRVLAADDVLSLVATEGGTATLPAGRVVVEGRYI